MMLIMSIRTAGAEKGRHGCELLNRICLAKIGKYAALRVNEFGLAL